MTGRRHAALVAASATAGLTALISLWIALDPTGWTLYLPGSALGLVGSAVYVAGGGRSLRIAVELVPMLGSGGTVLFLVVSVVVREAEQYGLLRATGAAPGVAAWLGWVVTFVVALPAVAGTLPAAAAIVVLRLPFGQ